MNGIKPTAERGWFIKEHQDLSKDRKLSHARGLWDATWVKRAIIYCASSSLWPVLSQVSCLGPVEEKPDGQKELERLQELW